MSGKFTRKTVFLVMLVILPATFSLAQDPYVIETGEFTLELPGETWKAVVKEGAAHKNLEFVYGDRLDGHLRIRKEATGEEVNLTEFGRSEADTKLRFMPGFIIGKDERFAGRLGGVVFNYEYTQGGKPMAGRVYYLRADDKTIYVLHFTGLRDRLQRIQNQTDAIARSFKLKN